MKFENDGLQLVTALQEILGTHYITPDHRVKTQNHKGYQMFYANLCVSEWVESFFYDSNQKVQRPLLDVGCAYGINTLQAAKRGAKVVCVDMVQNHLDALLPAVTSVVKNSCPQNIADNLDLRIQMGSLPFDIPQSPATDGLYSGILVSEVLHFLSVDQVNHSLQTLWSLLAPGGIICISTIGDGLIGIFKSEYRPEMARRVMEKREKEGYVVFDANVETGLQAMFRDEIMDSVSFFWQTFDAERLKRYVLQNCGPTDKVEIILAEDYFNHSYPDCILDDRQTMAPYGLHEAARLVVRKKL